MKTFRFTVAGAVAGVALAMAAVTLAQPYAGTGPGFGPGGGPGYAGYGMGGMGMGGGHGMGGPGHGHGAIGDPAAAVDARLTAVKSQLGITAAQEPAWQAYVAASKEQAAGMHAFHDRMSNSTTASDRVALRAAMMQQRATGMTAVSNAFSALYAVLTPEQRTIADQSRGVPGHHGMRFAPSAS